MGACSVSCCSLCCGIMSFLGTFFLIFLGIMIGNGSPSIELVDANKEDSSKACFISSAMYAGFCILSAFFYIRQQVVSKRPAGQDVYMELPGSRPSSPPIVSHIGSLTARPSRS
eukprot:GILK01008054.1.p1 GENE.GILK01008054.1~~GILK01008054.1.p1  ORF type:complete len:125 (-),score=5.13 GILK01008054.1:122-463(-)